MTNELIPLSTLKAADVFAGDKITGLMAGVKEQAAALVPDISTPTGRDEIKSMAYRIARSKTALDNMGKELTEDVRKQIDVVNAKRKTMREELDDLRDSVRKPLTDWENTEKDRVADHEDKLRLLAGCAIFQETPHSTAVNLKIDEAAGLCKRDWQEFKAKAEIQWQMTSNQLTKLLAERQTAEAEQEELERLRKEKAENDAELERLRKVEAEREAEKIKNSVPTPEADKTIPDNHDAKSAAVIWTPGGKTDVIVGSESGTTTIENLEPQLIIGVDMARPGHSDQTCVVLRYGQNVHLIPDPFASALLKHIEGLKHD